jgi:hypothetical protein
MKTSKQACLLSLLPAARPDTLPPQVKPHSAAELILFEP